MKDAALSLPASPPFRSTAGGMLAIALLLNGRIVTADAAEKATRERQRHQELPLQVFGELRAGSGGRDMEPNVRRQII